MIKASTRAIILKKVLYAGSSAIVTAYTEQYGVLSFMVRGLGKKGGKSATVQPLSLVEIEFNHKPSKQVQTLTHISLCEHSSSVFENPYKITVALFLSEILFKTLREESPDSALFQYLFGAIQIFGEDQFSADFHLIFLNKLTRFFGFAPQGEFSLEDPYFDLLHGLFVSTRTGSTHTLSRSQSEEFSTLFSLNFEDEKPRWTNETRRQNLQALITYYRLHLDGMGQIKSLPILEEIFSA